MNPKKFQRGDAVVTAIFYVVAALAVAAVIAWLYNVAEHWFVDPKQKLWDQEKSLLVARAKTCEDANGALATKFDSLREEVNGITKKFEDADKVRNANYAKDVEKGVRDRVGSQPKIDELVVRSRTASKEKDELGRCRAAQVMLNDYAFDVQKLKKAFGMVDIVGPTRLETK